MQRPNASVLLTILTVGLAACSVPTVSVTRDASEAAVDSPAGAQAPQAAGKESQAKKGDTAKERAKKARDLKQKERELARLAPKQQISALERQAKLAAAETTRERAGEDLKVARAALAHFVEQTRPRELEEHRIRIDRSTHRADHAKDELGELTAMYEADEFAKATKELVLKRGRRSQEMADRDLAVAKQKFDAFQKFDLPKRERELQRKVEDAERAVVKADLELKRVRMQHELAVLEEQDKRADLEAEIERMRVELEAKS
ncbi:MAG: hypothetical protein NXI31_15275 [bacterium]|nr:hypothetical protein [bacterium]